VLCTAEYYTASDNGIKIDSFGKSVKKCRVVNKLVETSVSLL
jgi:hypothetical protein